MAINEAFKANREGLTGFTTVINSFNFIKFFMAFLYYVTTKFYLTKDEKNDERVDNYDLY